MLLTSMASWGLPEPGMTLSGLVSNDVQSCFRPFSLCAARADASGITELGNQELPGLLPVDAAFGDGWFCLGFPRSTFLLRVSVWRQLSDEVFLRDSIMINCLPMNSA